MFRYGWLNIRSTKFSVNIAHEQCKIPGDFVGRVWENRTVAVNPIALILLGLYDSVFGKRVLTYWDIWRK